MYFRYFFIIFFLTALPVLSAPSSTWTSNDYYVTGVDFYAHRDYDKAISYLKVAVQKDPQNWQAYETLGYIHYLSSRPAEALAAFDQSLRWHVNNPKIRDLAEKIRAKIIWEAEARDIYPRVFRNYGIWFSLQSGAINASLGDFPAAASAFNNYKDPTVLEPHAQTDGFGLLGGMEVGFMLDKWSGWSVLFDAATFKGYKADWQDSFGNSLHETIQPDMISFQALYYRFFQLGRFRLHAGAGGGLYQSIVNLHEQRNDDVVLQDGQLSSLGWGVLLSTGIEMALGEQFAVGFSVRGRYATTSNIQGNVTNIFGASEQVGLALDSGLLEAYPPNVISAYNLPTAKIDYTGVDADLSISYHY